MSRMPKLFVRLGGRLVQTLELKPGLNRIGRDPAGDCLVDDPTVSGHHCDIQVSDDGVLVKDVNSTNGTFIAGRRVKEATLSPGQSLQLGLVEIGLDAPPIHVAVPAPEVQDSPEPTVLADGTPCCLNHPGVPATCACPQCAQFYCADCVRELRRSGGRTMSFCSTCNAPCQRLAATSQAIAAGQRPSWFGSVRERLKQTFRISAPPPRRRRSR